jgi:GNAT superfamily N-acetyltransferase
MPKTSKIREMNIEIRSLTQELREDYLQFFDNMIYDENPDWSICYCYDYHFLGDIATCTRESNRSAIIDMINEGKQTGYLVFDDDKAVGWCNANNRQHFKRLLRDYDLVDRPEDKVCSVVCFLIHPDYRRQGIAQKILEKIIEDCAHTDYEYIEVYPKKAEISCTGNFKGPLKLYERFDFKIHKAYDSYFVMRKSLK